MKEVVALMRFALLVKEVPRTGWNKKFPKGHPCKRRKVKNAESVAAHMYGLAFLAMLVADLFKVDRLRLIMMALVHDLVEAIAKDLVTVTETGKKRQRLEDEKKRKEQAAILMIARAGGRLGRLIKELWEEFEANQTAVARLLHQLDKIEMCLQAERYHSTRQQINPHEFFGSSKPAITERRLLKLLSQLEGKCGEP